MKVRVKLNREGVRNLLQSQMMMDAIKKQAEKEGEIDTSFVGFDRVQVIVRNENADRTDNT